MPSLILNTLADLCQLTGSLRKALGSGPASVPGPLMEQFSGLHDRIEAETIDFILKRSADLEDALPLAMQSCSRKVLSALPENDDAVLVDDASYKSFLQWAQAEDFCLAGSRGFRLGACLAETLRLTEKEPEIAEVVFGDLAQKGILMDGRDPVWAESSKIWTVGEIDQILSLLETQIAHFPREMSDALHRRAECNDAWGAEILFVAGARPHEGRALIAQDAPCLPGAFLDRAKSNHGLMAALHGPSPAELIASFRRNSSPF